MGNNLFDDYLPAMFSLVLYFGCSIYQIVTYPDIHTSFDSEFEQFEFESSSPDPVENLLHVNPYR